MFNKPIIYKNAKEKENIMTTEIDITKIVEEGKGDLELMWSQVFEATGRDNDRTSEIIEKLLDEEEAKVAEGEAEGEEGYEYKSIAANLLKTREQQAEDTRREYYKELYFTGVNKKPADPTKAWTNYYSTHPVEAEEDRITPIS